MFGFDSLGNLIPFTSQPYGNPAYLRADVSGLSGHGVASGSVSLLRRESLERQSCLNTEGTATTARGIFSIPPGQHSMVAAYSGDAGFNASISAPVNITVTKAATTTMITSSNSGVVQGTPVTLTATVSTSSATNGPTGQVNFLSGGTSMRLAGVFAESGHGNIQSGTFVPAYGTATSVVTLPAGQNIITALYPGDFDYTGSSSATTIVNVQADFAIAADAPSVTIASPGGSGILTLTVTGQPGYAGTINFPSTSCSGLPRESTCSFSPASITGSGSTTLTISTRAAHSARLESPVWWFTSFGSWFAGILLLGGASRRRMKPGRRARTVLTLMAFALLITIAGCGGGSSGGGGQNQDPGTPAGSSVVTVTATSGTITHSVPFTLTVQ